MRDAGPEAVTTCKNWYKFAVTGHDSSNFNCLFMYFAFRAEQKCLLFHRGNWVNKGWWCLRKDLEQWV